MQNRQLQVITLAASVFLVGLVCATSFGDTPEDFCAYYTRLDYVIPLDQADYIPTELDEESKQLLKQLEQVEEEEGEEEEDREATPAPDVPITGKYADVIVNVSAGRRLVFSRESSYLPYWKTENGKWFLDEIVPRQKDIACLYSYVRIIENTPERVVVHWRYMPNLHNVGRTTATHEYFEVTPDGTVLRRIKQGTADLRQWNDPENVTVQELKLTADGIEQVSFKPAKISISPKPPVCGSVVKTDLVGSPVAWWKFDEGLNWRLYHQDYLTEESISKKYCSIDGGITLWKKGVSGTALAFDGYESKVTLPASDAPKISDELTVEAWVVLGAYPWNWAPLVHQSLMDPGPIQKGTYDERGRDWPRKKGRGYYLGVGPYGYPLFVVDGHELKGSVKLSTYRWTHIAGVYGDGRMRIYVDGQECGSIPAAGPIDVPDVDLLIGLNNVKGRATDPVRGPLCHMATIYGIEGLIDEVKIYDEVLDASEIAASYCNFNPSATVRDNPDLEKRILPGEPGLAESFGATYTDLSYHELWDALWRTCGDTDVLVKFDDAPITFAFWRGVNGGAGWVTENNKWMSDQSVELGGWHGCSEHMSDKQLRHAHVRVIENTDARVVLHWRYASIDIGYLFPNIRYWTDEYYHIYPDHTAVRKVYFRNGTAGWHDVQFLNQPGTDCLDNVNLQAVTVANLKGDVYKMTWSGSNGVPRNRLRDACISMVNFKSEYKVFLVYPDGVHIGTWGAAEQSPHTDDPFAGPWNHWPVSQIPSDGRYAVANDRLTHAAFGGAGDVTEHGNMIMYGLTDKPITDLVPLSKSWNYPPALVNAVGCESNGYSKEQRAYQLRATADRISFTLDASESSPVHNAAFVIKNWGCDSKAGLKINGRVVKCGRKFRQGIVRDTDGTRMMVIWLEKKSTSPIDVEVFKQ